MKLYEAFREWTGVKAGFRSDRPEVEVSSLKGDHRGYLVVVNHSEQEQDTGILATVPVHSYSLISPEGIESLVLEGANAKLRLGPYEAAVLEWKQ